mmetsp:Transcript_36264/g.92609  ORF Transcript_36264/g.92609 Transcript_36264/m.92609 type:complete len:294 (-) Transcript_36264:332-1213(-)
MSALVRRTTATCTHLFVVVLGSDCAASYLIWLERSAHRSVFEQTANPCCCSRHCVPVHSSCPTVTWVALTATMSVDASHIPRSPPVSPMHSDGAEGLSSLPVETTTPPSTVVDSTHPSRVMDLSSLSVRSSRPKYDGPARYSDHVVEHSGSEGSTMHGLLKPQEEFWMTGCSETEMKLPRDGSKLAASPTSKGFAMDQWITSSLAALVAGMTNIVLSWKGMCTMGSIWTRGEEEARERSTRALSIHSWSLLFCRLDSRQHPVYCTCQGTPLLLGVSYVCSTCTSPMIQSSATE